MVSWSEEFLIVIWLAPWIPHRSNVNNIIGFFQGVKLVQLIRTHQTHHPTKSSHKSCESIPMVTSWDDKVIRRSRLYQLNDNVFWFNIYSSDYSCINPNMIKTLCQEQEGPSDIFSWKPSQLIPQIVRWQYFATHSRTFSWVSMSKAITIHIFPHERRLPRWSLKTWTVHCRYFSSWFPTWSLWHFFTAPSGIGISHLLSYRPTPLPFFCASGVPRWRVNNATLDMPHRRQELICLTRCQSWSKNINCSYYSNI